MRVAARDGFLFITNFQTARLDAYAADGSTACTGRVLVVGPTGYLKVLALPR